tara:strand:+ start:517 stop:750 length:234 start_codon:yes stop_codon:yes gene_type:complete
MSTNKRERQRARRDAQANASERADKNTKRNKVIVRWVAIAGAVFLVAFLWSLTGGDSQSDPQPTEETSAGAKTLGIE